MRGQTGRRYHPAWPSRWWLESDGQKFPEHSGFDIDSIKDAVRQNPHRRIPRGASTISQQVAKNLFPLAGTKSPAQGIGSLFYRPDRAAVAKAEDSRGLPEHSPVWTRHFWQFEVQARSTSTNLHPSWVLYEAALLAAVLPNPKRFDFENPSDYVRERARKIQQEVTRLGGPEYLKGL